MFIAYRGRRPARTAAKQALGITVEAGRHQVEFIHVDSTDLPLGTPSKEVLPAKKRQKNDAAVVENNRSVFCSIQV